QLMGGIVLHQGRIAEMKTGEGKTLASTMPSYLNAIEPSEAWMIAAKDKWGEDKSTWKFEPIEEYKASGQLYRVIPIGKGVHIITVNDYLARRDRDWMGPVLEFLGLNVGVLQNMMPYPERKEAYASDITYGTNSEFGFDYLRDNMVVQLNDCVQRPLTYAILDEVDSILVDEARTPLIISGPAEESTDKYYKINKFIPRLKKGKILEDDVDRLEALLTKHAKKTVGDYVIDEKSRTVILTEDGIKKFEGWLGVPNLYENKYFHLVHHINQALKAHHLFKRDKDYLVKGGEVLIVDEFTGRIMDGRRFSDGLHQALEAKESVAIKRENQTLATITLQNYFRMYKKLSGMTGTALTEAVEFDKIYKLDVIVIPTNEPMIRVDYSDIIYKTVNEKFEAIINEARELHKVGRPILIGTVSIEKSERLSKLMNKAGLPHNVLNAKYHEKEAEIIARAGIKSAITIATNMAGRGTDIKLGEGVIKCDRGSDGRIKCCAFCKDKKCDDCYHEFKPECREVVQCGLHIVGSERHESRRIDNQLRGRSGRQGDPGSSRFFVSLEDDLMRLFGSDKIKSILEFLGVQDGEAIENAQISKQIEKAQKKVEEINFGRRKHLLEYDDVNNKQRQIVYKRRREILESKDASKIIWEMIENTIEFKIDEFCPANVYPESWDLETLDLWVSDVFSKGLPIAELQEEILNVKKIKAVVMSIAKERYSEKKSVIGSEIFPELEKRILLDSIDRHWKEHLYGMDHLQDIIGYRAYAQKNPLVEYKKESFTLFDEMIIGVENDSTKFLFKVQIQAESINFEKEPRKIKKYNEVHSTVQTFSGPGSGSGQAGKPPRVHKKGKSRIGKRRK
ncbi:preprotein translocase subunit SecA, partial [Candidatus Dependentiae bacterium]|nr:preprotein translocase subunit SecA [Candidatus Dependentiae bacterium]